MVAEPFVARSGCRTATKAPAKPAMPSSLMKVLLRGRSGFTPGPLAASLRQGARARGKSATPVRAVITERVGAALEPRGRPQRDSLEIVGSFELPVRAPILGSV